MCLGHGEGLCMPPVYPMHAAISVGQVRVEAAVVGKQQLSRAVSSLMGDTSLEGSAVPPPARAGLKSFCGAS